MRKWFTLSFLSLAFFFCMSDRAHRPGDPVCRRLRAAHVQQVRPDGTEVLALFNYDTESPISVSAAGRTVRLEPLAVEFIEVK